MDIIEKVARAIAVANKADPDYMEEHWSGPTWEKYRVDAIAALDCLTGENVLVKILRDEDYNDVHPELIAGDALDEGLFGYEVLWPTHWPECPV